MALNTTTIEPGEKVAAPLEYTLKDSQALAPQSISALFDGSAAAGPFLACCTFLAQDGKVIARCPIASAMAAGDTAEVTFAPFLEGGSSGADTGDILFDVDNSGTWLDITTTGFEPIDGNGMHFKVTGDGNPMQLDSQGGFSVNDTHGWGITIVSTTGTGGSADFTLITGRDVTINCGRTVSMQSVGFFNVAAGDTLVLGASNQVQVVSNGTGGINVQVNSATAELFIQGTAGALIVLDPTILPTVAPGTSHALWNNGGVLHITP